MADTFDKFQADVTEGVEVNTSDFSSEFGYLFDSFNVTNGIHRGLGPRYGMSVIPGHNSKVVQAVNETPGLVQSESVVATAGLTARQGIVAIFPVKMTNPTGFGAQATFWAYVIWREVASLNYYDVVFSSTFDGTRWAYSSDISQGLHQDIVTAAATFGWSVEMCNRTAVGLGKFSGAQTMVLSAAGLSDADFNNPATAIIMSVSGPKFPAHWLFGLVTDIGGAAEAPSISFRQFNMNGGAFTTAQAYTSAPAEWNLGNYDKIARNATIYALTADLNFNISYRINGVFPTSIFNAQARYGSTEIHVNLSATAATKITAGVAFANSIYAIYNDTKATISSSYKAILNAPGKAQCWIMQDWAVSANGCLPQAVDLTSINYNPPTIFTRNIDNSADYTEDGTAQSTIFSAWPIYTDDVAMVGAANGPSFGSKNTGVLRANTSYELTFSVFNKRLNYESNVGRGVKFRTGTNDFVALNLWLAGGAAGPSLLFAYLNAPFNRPFMFFPGGTSTVTEGRGWDVNHLEYRFYYRPLGAFEWLPALFIDAVKLWHYTGAGRIRACVGAIAGLPGGQPGGFVDYSPLPQDKYDCVVQYKNRAFWLSPQACYFSLKDNVLAYPGRNSIAAVTGEFKGAKVHNYPGQAEQTSRLVIFGSKETYVGRFTGQPTFAPVQVSPDTIGQYPLDGSDFVMDPWTSITAFSHRSAVIADGILYWWGPQGVFRDDGVQTPTKISLDLEPDIFDLIEAQFGDAVMGHYNSRTKEILWVYTPKGTTVQQNKHGIIFDLKAARWRRVTFNDAVTIGPLFDLDVTSADNALAGIPSGARTIAVARTGGLGLQRAYFFDQHNLAGDLFPLAEYIVSSVTFPSADHTLIRFDADPVSGKVGSIAIGDRVAVQANQISSAWGAAINAVGIVESLLPGIGINVRFVTSDVVAPLVVGTVAKKYRFAIFTESGVAPTVSNAIPWQTTTAYWMPKGVNYWAYWRYVYFMFLYKKWDGADPTFELEHKTSNSPSYESETLTIVNNSDDNSQIYHPLTVGDMNAEGQAIKLKMSGSHIGHEWVLQYLEAHAQELEGDLLKTFEG